MDMKRVLIEAALGRALNEMERSPERSIRKLIDLGLTFSSGRFQQHFLSTAQEMLRRKDSAYYDLLRDTLEHVERSHLVSLGMALGYHSCTHGAAVIRSIEAERGFNIPWSLSLEVDDATSARCPTLIQEGIALGIHTYLLFPTGDLAPLQPLMASHPDCAFFLFLPAAMVTEELISAMAKTKNAMAVVRWEDGAQSACERLRRARLPFSIYHRYTEEDHPAILDGGWMEHILPLRPLFALLSAEGGCTRETLDAVYDYLSALRASQNCPVVPIDLCRDNLRIDEIISDDGCLVGFDRNGVLHTHNGILEDEQYNLLSNRLEDILRALQALR